MPSKASRKKRRQEEQAMEIAVRMRERFATLARILLPGSPGAIQILDELHVEVSYRIVGESSELKQTRWPLAIRGDRMIAWKYGLSPTP